MDDGLGGEFNEVVGQTTLYTLNSLLITSNIGSGRNYRFKYRAKNIHGWGGYSPVSYILAATVPSSPVGEPETKVLEFETTVTITWQKPSNVGGENVEIIHYKVEILLKNGAFETVCDGYDATLISTRTCKVPMETFLTSPFNFSQGDTIKARITASNSLG